MPLQILKKIKSLFKGKSSKAPAETEQAKPVEKQSRQGRRDGFSSRRERDQKRREHSEMSDATNKVMPRQRRSEKSGERKPQERKPQERKQERQPQERKQERQPQERKADERRAEGRRPRRDETSGAGRGEDSRRRRGEEGGRGRSREHGPAAEIDYESVHAENGDWTVEQFVVEPAEGKKRFHDFDIPVEIMHAIADLGFQYCTPIQAGSLEQAMAGANVAGRAQTGTGKTAAYLVAILTRYLRTPDKRQEKSATPRALVIAPTRELRVQICRDAQALGKYCGLRSLAVFGGMDYGKQSAALAEGTVDLLAATPGRLLDFQRQHIVDLSKIDTLVIDEADRMLDMGFIPDVRRIIRALPQERQTLLYSATLDDEVMRLASQWMPNPVKVEIEPEKTANQSIDQKVFIVTSDQKFTILCHLLDQYAGQRVLIFGNRRVSTDHLAEKLRRQGYPCELLSGEVSQGHRMAVLDRFREGSVKIVVATDVAGRGLHIADIGLVVNFELPYEAEDYVHRIGRTGRAGKVGTSVSFADEDESFIIPDIEKYIGEELKCTNPDDALLAPLERPQRRRSGGRDEARPAQDAASDAREGAASPGPSAPAEEATPDGGRDEARPAQDTASDTREGAASPGPSATAEEATPDGGRDEARPAQDAASDTREDPASPGPSAPAEEATPDGGRDEARPAQDDGAPDDESASDAAPEGEAPAAEGGAPAHRRRRRHHRRGRGGKREGEATQDGTAPAEAPAAPSPAAPAPAAPPPPPPPKPAPRIPRAVMVPKGATEQVWVPGQN